MKKLIEFEQANKLWEIKFKDIPIWSYIRGSFASQFLPYKGKFKVTYRDFLGFFLFISLFFRKNQVIFFITGRQDLLMYAESIIESNFNDKKAIFFIRNEGEILGNSFFIEFFRFFCRKFLWITYYLRFKQLKNKFFEVDETINTDLIKDAIGDYIFYKIIYSFLKKHTVIYSNCVIPRVARYLEWFDASELQHGVIHKEHLDYINVPYIQNNFICYSDIVKNNLIKWGYSGNISVINKKSLMHDIRYNFVIFTTVDACYSLSTQNIVKSFKSVSDKIFIKKHPRDIYSYKIEIDGFLTDVTPLHVNIPILPDTSMISDCFLNSKYFIYYSLDGDKESLRQYILEKYNIYEKFCDFDIIIGEKNLLIFLQGLELDEIK